MRRFIRSLLGRNGAVVLQVMQKDSYGQNRVVKHIGTAKTDLEALRLRIAADEVVRDGQMTLGFDEEIWQQILAEEEEAVLEGDEISREHWLLWQVLQDAYRAMGFDQAVGDSAFEQMVLARIVEPTSKTDTVRVIENLGVQPFHRNTFTNSLRRCKSRDYRGRLATACFQHATKLGDLSLVLYDVTTLYFEAEQEDSDAGVNQGLRKVGYSKERRVDPQITVGLLVDRNGFPLEIGCFEGNKAETKTILPVLRAFQARHGLDSFVVVADAGMLSSENLKAIDEAGFRFIVGARQTKAPHDLESHFHWHGDYFADGQIIDTVTPRHANARVNNRLLKAEPVWNPSMDRSWRAIWQYTKKRARKDTKSLGKEYRRAMDAVDGVKPARKPRFVKAARSGYSFDKKGFERAEKLVGLKGYVTNLPNNVMPASEIIDSYHELWHVEQSFRMSKTDLRARPIFHRQKDAINAHLTIVMAALAISRYLYAKTGIPTKKLVRKLHKYCKTTGVSRENGQTMRITTPLTPKIRKILKKLYTQPQT